MFTFEVRSFVDFLTEASIKHGHQSAIRDITVLVTHLLDFGVRFDASLPSSEFVRHAVRLSRVALDRHLYGDACEVVTALSETATLEDHEPYPYSMTAMKQVGDWIVQEPLPRSTFREVVYYQDPFSCFVEALSSAINQLESAPSYEVLRELQLVCEVAFVRSWTHRSCEEIQQITYPLTRSAVLAAEQTGEYGHLLPLATYKLHQTYEQLLRKECEESASQVLEEMAEVIANGFRSGLKSQFGARPGRQAIKTFVKSNREMVVSSAREIYTRGHYMYIPEEARQRFVRAVQDELDDNLDFTGRIAIDTTNDED